MILTIDTLIDALSHSSTAPDAFNLYADTHAHNAIRRHNLRHYLMTMQARHPQSLLVMEAPGYRGCRLTGIPVTSRKVMLEGVPELNYFGATQGFQDVQDIGFERVYSEQSATIVWNTLADLKVLPLIWNAFPFHPHQPDKPMSNRRPRQPELEQGGQFLGQIISLFRPPQIIAIGNVAHDTLSALGHDVEKVRHPAQGGKNDFVRGLTTLLSTH